MSSGLIEATPGAEKLNGFNGNVPKAALPPMATYGWLQKRVSLHRAPY